MSDPALETPTVADIREAADAVADFAIVTPLEPSPELSRLVDGDVRLKLELIQPTGSFKIRGAYSRVSRLPPGTDIITASSGNHALAVMAAAQTYGLSARILVGRTIPEAKLRRLRQRETDRISVEVLDVGSDDAELVARARSIVSGAIYVAPYNDRWVIAGQGTVGLEIAEQWPDCDTVVVPVGGGGLVSGIALAMRAARIAMRTIGVQPTASPTIEALLRSGSREPVAVGPTIADGVAGNIEPGSITWDLCSELVDEVVVLEEAAIRRAIRWAVEVPHLLIEGSAALALAAVMERPSLFRGHSAAIVLTGRLVDTALVREILADGT